MLWVIYLYFLFLKLITLRRSLQKKKIRKIYKVIEKLIFGGGGGGERGGKERN